MDESEDNISADDTKSEDTSSSVKSKPKKRSLVERELETNLTARITSPVANGGAYNTSRYGRARRVKTDSDFSDSEKFLPKSLNSPALEMTPSNAQLPPVYKMYASNSPVKSETAETMERKSASIETNLDNQIESIYNENILLSRFSSNEKKKQSPNTKFPKVYVRTDLIQKKEKEETITLIKNMFSPKSGKKSGNCHLNNILERSSEKYNLNASTTKTKHQNGLTNMSSVVKTLDFDNNKKKKENYTKMVLSKSDIFDLEAKCEYQVGDLAWARMGTYPFWPSIITREPITNMFVKKKLFGRVEHHVIHVTFFGDNGRRSWIVDSMLRKFLGQLEFETTREHLGPTAKKRDPKLYAAFFVSEKKMSQWSISVEEAETLLREPKRLRIDIFNDMLVKSRNVKSEKQNKSNKVVRTSSNVSLSESLFDTLFSEKEGQTEDLDGSRSKNRNSLDVSEVVTACLDNMAAKTGNSKIQRQSHMDRWLQKAKSKTPEKLQMKLQITTKEKEKVSSFKKKRWEAPKNVPIKKPYSFRNSLESQTLKSHHNEHDYSSSETTADVVDTAKNCVMPGGGIGIIAKVESLKDKAEDKKYDILVEIIDSVDQDVTCESPTFTQDYNEMYGASVIQDIDMVKSNEDSEKPKSNEINGINLGKQEKVGTGVILSNNQGRADTESQHLNMLNEVAETSSLFDDKIKKATEKFIEIDFEKTYHKTPKNMCYSDMNVHLEKSTKMNTRSGTDISNKKSRTGDTNIEENIDVSISSKHDSYIDINKSSDSVTIQDSDTSFNTSSQGENDRSLSYFTRPRTQNKSTRKRRSLRLKTPKKPHAAKNRDDGFAKYAELRQDALIDDHPELTHTEIMAYLLKTWQYENRDESDADNTSKDIKIERNEKEKECENTLNSTKKSDDNKCKDIDVDQDRNQSKDKPIENTLKITQSSSSQDHNQSRDKSTTKSFDDETKSKDLDLSKDHYHSKEKPTTKPSNDDIKSEGIDISQDHNQSKDKPTTKSFDDDAKGKDLYISKVHNHSKEKPTTKPSDDDIKSKDINISEDHNQCKDKPTTKLFDDDAKTKDIDISKDHNHSKEKPTTKPSDDDIKNEDIDISQDHNQCKDKPTTKSSDDDAKSKDINVSQNHNHSKDKPTTKPSDDDIESKDIDISQDHNQCKDKPITKSSDDDAKSKDINVSQDHNHSKDKPTTKPSDDDIESEDIDISQDHNQSKDVPTTKSFDDDAKSKDLDISKDHNHTKDKPTTKPSDDDIKSEHINISQDHNQSKDKPTTKSFDDDAKGKDLFISKDHNHSKEKPTTKPSDDDIKSEDIDISKKHNHSKDKPTTKLSDIDAMSKDIDISQDLNQTIDKPIENTLNSTKSSDDDVKSKNIDKSQNRNNSKKKVSNALNKIKRSAIDNIKAQAKNKVCTVNLTDILLDGSMNMTFINADATFVKAVYDKANKLKKINNKKDNHKNRVNSLNLNDVFALKTDGTTSKMNDTVTSCKSMGSDLLNNSCDSVLINETQNGYNNTNRRRFSVTAIQKNKEKPINNKKSESYTTSMSKKDNNSTNVLSHDKFIEEKDDDQDDTVVGKPENEIPDMDSELSSEINNDSLLIKNCNDKKNIQDENLCDEFVENKENVNIENSHTEISCAPNSELNIDFTENMFTGSSAIITVNNSNTNVNTGVDNGQEIACILKSIDDIIYDDKPDIEQINPKLDQIERLEEINPVKKDLNSFNTCDNKEFNQNKEVVIAILTKNDETSKSQIYSKEQPELSINNEIVNADKKMLNRNINEADDTVGPLQNLPEPVKINGFHSSDDCSPDFSDGEFNVETSSVNSEDSEPLSKVRHKLRLKNRHKKNIDVNYPEFIKYMELRQDALMDDHPELSQEELVDYMRKAWLYEQNSKSDYMKTDDIERSGLVKGLNDDLRQKSIRNSFRENKKRRNKQKDENSLSINSDITSKESSPERKLLVKSEDTKSMRCDISDRLLRRKRRIKSLDETLKTQIIPEYFASDMPPVPDNQIISSNAYDTENKQELIAIKKTQPSSSNDCSTQRYFEIFNHVEGKHKDRSVKKSEEEVKIKEEFDPDAVSIKSDDIEVSLSKRKQRRYEKQANKDDPEFLKYLELRQDALIDENPQLSQDEIISYLYKTWLYEEGTKSDIKKSDDIEQASLVKGLNPEAMQPKKVRRKIKNEKEPIDDDVVPKDKPKRKTSQPYYIEDELSDTEDIEMFDIFKSKQQLQNNEDDVVDTGDEIDEVELYFSELTKQKPNIFKGLVREKVCEICESTSNLVKCKGCSCMFHVDCVKKQLEVKVEVPVSTRGRKKKKKPGRKPKNLDESESQSDDKSQDFSEENNVSVDDLEPESQTVDAEDFESVLEVKMKELIPIIEIYDSYSSDDGLDWNDSVAGKCEIVDVVLKPKSEPVDYSDFKCNNCVKYDLPTCFVCKYVISKTGVEYRQRCQTAHCNTYYHMECLDHWPQTQFNAGELSKISNKPDERFEDFMCPRHVCHTCVCDDPRGCKTRFSGDKLARCVRCPATYHSFTKCLPAGSQILTGSHIVCPRHYENRPGKVPCHVNTGWCFICALGGSLICCEYCPTSFHAECLNIKPPEGGYMCEDCETGRLPLYGEMVWVKLGHYRWWPGIVLHPSEIPENIMAVKHSPGEFVVRFFGQYDHYWVNRGRIFPFQEGDSGRVSSQKSKIDAAFTTAMEHAQRACEILKAENNEVEDTDIASSLLPPHYVKLKVNKPVGSLCGRRIDIEESSLTQCDCNPDEEDPCGPYSQCLNRMLLTECGPSCRAGDRCNNRSFEKRRYPRVAPYRTPHRGWGLRTLQDIKAGTFVIEYVGELLDEEEFRRRMNRKHEIRDENFYFLTLDKERMIDAGPKGNLARFMNHCCEPNCETQKWTVLGDVRVGLFAIKDIPANSELTFNYNLECTGIEKKRCMCGAKRCSGYIGAKPKQDEPQQKKKPLLAKRPYKKRNKTTEDSPSTNKNKPKRPVGRPAKPKELTEIEKDLLIIKNATNGLSSDSEGSGRLSSLDSDKNIKALKRKRVDFSADDVILYDTNSPSSKKAKVDDEKTKEVGD